MNGECVGLGKCPCDPGAYCDENSGLCVEGCLVEEDCPEGEYCDTAAKSCEPGCAYDDECPSGQVCDLLTHTCNDPCAGCEDDGNPCTYESCGSGECVTGNLPLGEACDGPDDGNECTVPGCDGNGSCGQVPVNAGVVCNVADLCRDSECDGVGGCEVTWEAWDGTECEDNYEAVCRDQECVPTEAVCSFGNHLYPLDWEVATCGCVSNTLLRSFYDFNSPAMEYDCSQCVSYGSTDVCYP